MYNPKSPVCITIPSTVSLSHPFPTKDVLFKVPENSAFPTFAGLPPPPPVVPLLLQLIENSNINDNNVIRNVLKELLFKVCNSRFALLNVYTVSHFYCLHKNLFIFIIIYFLLFVKRLF